jgi:hypothetical protein
MRLTIRVAVVTALVLTLAACARTPMSGGPAPDVDPKLTTHSYIEEGDLVSFVVGTRPTGIRAKDEFIPFEIAVANRGLRTLTLSRESFQLVDSEGRRYHVASPQDLMERYEFLDWDRQLSELPGIVDQRYAVYTRYRSKLSPTREFDVSGVVQDLTQVPQYGYIIDYIYFPRPESGVTNRKFELFMEAPELPDPIFVKFEVRS